ncbi:DUF1810 domain-containing protein [Methylolobus aquaticus]|nr:DUF1810 domain-containing protein [Methylolobus aquaticus]
MSTPDRDSLERFVRAQEHDYSTALAELRAGLKRAHWIWFVLPQLRGLGQSHMAQVYGLANREEATAYARHPVLGPRLVECVNAILTHADRSAVDILGDIDAIKFRSCLTLFIEVAPNEPCFRTALNVFYEGQPDTATLRLLEASAGRN